MYKPAFSKSSSNVVIPVCREMIAGFYKDSDKFEPFWGMGYRLGILNKNLDSIILLWIHQLNPTSKEYTTITNWGILVIKVSDIGGELVLKSLLAL